MFEQFEFRDFAPPPELAASADATLNWLLDIAPSDAWAWARVGKIGQTYVCRIDLRSSSGFFKSDILAITPEDAIDKAIRSIRDDLKTWRHDRGLGPTKAFLDRVDLSA